MVSLVSRRAASGLGLFATCLILGTMLHAATPASGTLSAASPELNYSSGPFSVSNPSSDNAGGVCAGTVNCDHYDLTVDYAGLNPTQEVSITVSWPNANEDYDIYLMRADGTVVSSSAGGANPEVIVVPVSGLGDPAYRVRIVPFLATGGSTATRISLGGGSGGAPPEDPCAVSGASNGGSAVLSPGLASELAHLAPVAAYGAYVHFSRGTPAQQNALLTAKGLTVAHDFRKYATSVFATGPVRGFRALVTEPSVSYMEENRRLNYLGETASWASRARVAQEPVAGGPYSAADGKTLRGDGVTLVVVDSGVNAPHPDFEGRVVHNYKVVGSNVAPGAAVVEDLGPNTSSDTTGGHGTHVAGIALGSGAASTGDYPVADAAPNTQGTFTGVAPAASLIAYGSGETLVILSADIAFQHILDHYDEVTPRIRIISNSYGSAGGGAYSPASTASCLTKALVKRGVSVIFAASNDGGDGSADLTSPTCKDPTPGVICVANYNDNGTGALNNALDSSSSRGKKGDPANYPDIAAPGADYTAACAQAEPGQGVCATGAETRWQPYYGTISGTSMATPHVAGAIALLYQARPELTPAQVEDLIQDSARKVTFNGAYDADPQNQGGTINFGVGAGLLNVQAALDALGVAHPGLPAGGSEVTIIDGDADAALAGAADVVKLTMQEGMESANPGIIYRIAVRDAANGAAGVVYNVHQNVNGAAFVTRIESGADGVTVPEPGPGNTAAATSASRAGNVVSLFVPYKALGYPPVGAPIHNIRVLSNSDFAPSPSAPTTAASLEPMFGKLFTVLLDAGSPPPLNPCELPGVTVVNDPLGDAQNTRPAFDIESLAVAEPATLDGKIVFTMQVADLATLPPNTFWAVRFNTPTPPANGDEAYFVGLTTVGGTVRYVYGTSSVQATPAASLTVYEVAGDIDQDNSSFDADGTITMVADKSLFMPLNSGELINNFIGTTRTISQDEGPIAGGSQDTAEGGFYILREAAACTVGGAGPGSGTPGSALGDSGRFGGALPLSVLLGLMSLLGLRRAGSGRLWRA